MDKKILGAGIAIIVVIAGIALWFLFGQNLVGKEGIKNNNSPLSQSKVLDMSNENLTSVPYQVFTRTTLEELDISNNNISGSLPAEIRHLVNLRVLNASNNQMTGLPAEIGQLQNLQVLYLSNNKLTGLPHELGNLKNLQILNLSGNNYSSQDLAIIKSQLPATTKIILK